MVGHHTLDVVIQVRILAGLPGQDSNLDNHIQSVVSYHWTTRQSTRRSRLRVPDGRVRGELKRCAGTSNRARGVRDDACSDQPALLPPGVGSVGRQGEKRRPGAREEEAPLADALHGSPE